MSCRKIDPRCASCRLAETRTRVVSGKGRCPSKLMFIGEAPGREEDLKGEPFVGRAGALLDEALMDAGTSRKEVYISNLVKCRPPGNRRPRKDEVKACTSLYLREELARVRPEVVCALGQTATEHLIGKKVRMKELVGRETELEYAGRKIRMFVAYHPAACLYQRRNTRAFKEAVRAAVLAAGLARKPDM